MTELTKAPATQVLILAYCGHRRWVDSPAPMDADQRAIEKCRPCPHGCKAAGG